MIANAFHLCLKRINLLLLVSDDVIEFLNQVLLIGDFGFQFDDAIFHRDRLVGSFANGYVLMCECPLSAKSGHSYPTSTAPIFSSILEGSVVFVFRIIKLDESTQCNSILFSFGWLAVINTLPPSFSNFSDISSTET